MKLLEKLLYIDQTISFWISKNQNKTIKTFFQIITAFGSGYIWIILYTALFWAGAPKLKSVILLALKAELIGLLIIITLRNLVQRQRPDAHCKFLAPLPWNKNSFPSHHALRASALTALFGINYSTLLPFFIFALLLISFSRIYLLKHFLTDVLSGLFAGILCASLSQFL